MSNPESELATITRPADTAFVTAVEEGERATEPMTVTSTVALPQTSRRGVAAILISTVGNSAAVLMPPLVGLPIYIQRFDSAGKAGSLGLVLGLTALVALVLTPIFGALSDRTTSRFGMRRPGMIVGTAIIVAGLVIEGLSGSVSHLLLGALIMAAGASVFTASYSALIPDQVAAGRRGRVLGFQSLVLVVMGVTAAMIGPAMIDNQFALFTVGGVLMIVTTTVAVFLLKDRVLDRQYLTRQPLLRSLVDGFVFSPKSAPDFAWVWVSRFLMTLGVSFGGFGIYFLTDQLHVTDEQLPGLISLSALVNLAGTVIGTLLGAFVSDKLGRLKSLVLFVGLIFAAGGVITAFSPTVPVFMLATGVIALGIGSFLPIDGALVMAVLPGGQSQTGKYMSIITIADQLPRSIGPFLAPAVVAIGAATPLGGYPLLYLIMGIFAVAGGFVVRHVKTVR